MSASFRIGLVNWIIIGICVLILASPLGHKPGAMPLEVMGPFFYILFSFVISLVGVMAGVEDWFRGVDVRWVCAGIVLNLGHLAVFFGLVQFRPFLGNRRGP